MQTNMSLLSRFTFNVLNVSHYNFSSITSNHIKSYLLKRKAYLIPYVWKSTKPKSDPSLEHLPHEVNTECSQREVVSFQKMVENRRCESQRSILVQVHSEQSCTELHEYCSKYGDVKGLHHYTLPESLHFVLVEFQRAEDVKNVLTVCSHMNRHQIVPVRSPLLWFRANERNRSKKLTTAAGSTLPATLVEQFGNASPTQAELRTVMLQAGSVSEQVRSLHNRVQLGDLGSRLRFLTARQMELALSGLFPLIQALPFGSSVNGFGKIGCDLDLVLELDSDQDREDSRLVFHAKTCLANERSRVQRHMGAVGDICDTFLPGCSHVRRILQARVPIVKFRQELMAVDCDVSITNMCAVHMSELLYVLSRADERVPPLVCSVRHWASRSGITSEAPGRWVTNFSLTLMVLFFLQQHHVLPSVDTLRALAGPQDQRITAEGVNCTFLRDISKLNNLPKNTDSLEILLFKFFEYYSAFDFTCYAISLGEGIPAVKPEQCALYITNPLERGLNVSKNVSMEELERLRIELRNAAWCLESAMDASPAETESWGLVELFDKPSQGRKVDRTTVAKAGGFNARLVDVKNLFGEEGGVHAARTQKKTQKSAELKVVAKPLRSTVKRRKR